MVPSDKLSGEMLLEAWRQIECDVHDCVPRKTALSPSSMQKLLPRIFIIEQLTPTHCVMRLTGTEIDALYGTEIKKLNMYDIKEGEGGNTVRAFYDKFFSAPYLATTIETVSLENGDQLATKTTHLPLVNNNGDICFKIAYVEAGVKVNPYHTQDQEQIQLIGDKIETTFTPIAELLA